MIQIDKNIQIPDYKSKAKLYPFKDLSIGDSFFAPGKTPTALGACSRHYKPKKFLSRTVIENDIKGARCWRTE